MVEKSITGSGTYSRNSVAWDAVVLFEHKDKTALSIFGDIDAVKVRSCMTMFDFLSPNDIFGEVLDSFYQGERCETTLKTMQYGRDEDI